MLSSLRPAVVARGAAAGGGLVLVRVVLGVAEPAGCLGGGGKMLLWSSAFIEARFRRLRRTASATVYKAWWWLLPGGWRYGVSGDV